MSDTESPKKKFLWSQIYHRPKGVIDVSGQDDSGEKPKRRPAQEIGIPCSEDAA